MIGDEVVIARYVHEAIRNKEISDGTFAAAHQLLGDQGITDLTLTVAYYTALAIAQIALKPEMGGGRVSTL